tara:strand:+ start:2639 stop:3334 length:696 start_codon:yes stop_codon:yes gene_type:complete
MIKNHYILIGILLIFITLLLYYLNNNYNLVLHYVLQYDDDIKIFIDKNLFLALLMTICVTIICIIFLLPITPITIITGYYFGIIYGFSTIYFAQIIGCSILYFFCGSLFKIENFINKIKNNRYKKIFNNLENDSFYYLVLIRVIGGIPFSLQSIIGSLSGMKYFSFLLATLIGIIPWLYIYINVGVTLKNVININNIKLKDIIDYNILLALMLMIIVFLLPLFIKYKKKLK